MVFILIKGDGSIAKVVGINTLVYHALGTKTVGAYHHLTSDGDGCGWRI